MRSIICRYVITSGPPTSKLSSERGLVSADAGEVADDVVERDRLRGRRDPARRDHRRQPVDEGDDGLEGCAPLADDHRGAQRRDRGRSGSQALAGLAPAAEVRRGGGAVVAEPAEVDDLARRPRCSQLGDVLRGRPILALEVPRAEGVDEVVDDLRALDGSRDVVRGGRVALDPADARLRLPSRLRDTATSSWSAASRGRSAVPTTPVAPKTTTFTRLPSRPGDRSSGG